MTCKELLNTIKEKNNNIVEVEIYQYKSKVHKLHNDFITSIEYENISSDDIADYEIMDEERYNNTILCNTSECANFDDWFGDKNAKILVIILKEVYE